MIFSKKLFPKMYPGREKVFSLSLSLQVKQASILIKKKNNFKC